MMIKKITGASLLVSLALMSGCASYNKSHFTVGSIPDDYRTRHPIIVSENETVQDIVIPRHTKSLPLRGRDLARSMGFNFKSSGAKSIAIMIPSGSPNERAAKNAASDVVAEFTQVGIKRSQIIIKHYDAASHGSSATLRLVYTDLSASIDSKCGQWNEDLIDTKDNKNYANFGCATQNNLAAQIANPADLLGPRAMSEIDSTKRTTVIEDWRNTTTDLSDSF
ncbi:MAG: CpaD family pilus assembly protein [Salaquimonas sp.]